MKMKRTGRIAIALVTVLLLVLIGACAPTPKDIAPTPAPPAEEVTPTPTSPEPITPAPTGDKVNFRFLISDDVNAIEDFEHLYVIISSIGVHQGGESGTWYPLDPVPDPDDDGIDGIDLVPLEGLNAVVIWEGTLPAGDYTKVFIYVNDEDITGILLDGETANVKLPSQKLQISEPFTISEDQVVNFVYDITVVKAGESGMYILKPQIAQSGTNQDFNDMTPGALEITTTSLPNGQVGGAYSATVEATGGTEPYTWSISDGSLPDGLILDSATGVISGTPTTEGDYDFTVQVEDSSDPALSTTEELSIDIIVP